MTDEVNVSTETLQALLSAETELLQEASEAVPHKFDKCTYLLGYIRQSVHLCKTCPEPRGICSACSIACHGDHEQVELFPKRAFRCDCPTSCMKETCALHKTTEEPNEQNVYDQNYLGNFCRCGKPYEASTEDETMNQCVVCEDWFHESCLHIRDAKSVSITEHTASAQTRPRDPSLAYLDDAQSNQATEDAESVDSDDDPSLILQPSSYESFVCGKCVRKTPLLQRWAGSKGIRMIVWESDPQSNGVQGLGRWTLLGEDAVREKDEDAELDVGDDHMDNAEASSSSLSSVPSKRALSPFTGSAGTSLLASTAQSNKRPRLDDSAVVCSAPPADGHPQARKAIVSSAARGPFLISSAAKSTMEDGDGDGDLFLSYGWRLSWCRCPKCLPELEKQPYLMDEQEIYEPPKDPEAALSFEELGMRALEKLPRDKAIDGIRAYNDMRDDLMIYLRPFAEGGRVVSDADVKSFFESRLASLKNKNT